MIIAHYFLEFLFYSFLGWVWESIYCTANEKKWADRGFLFGPICPIYGACVVVTSIVFSLVPQLSNPSFPIWGTFIICYLGSAVAEFGTSWILEKRFHARWWDYSNLPLNIQGRICVPVSIAFGVAGVLVVKYLIPFVENVRTMFSPNLVIFLALVMAMVFGADFALTEASLSALLKDVKEMHLLFNIRAQDNYERIVSTSEAVKGAIESGQAAIVHAYEETTQNVEEFAKAYTEKLGFNQKRILSAMTRFVPDNKRFTKDLAENGEKLLKRIKNRL